MKAASKRARARRLTLKRRKKLLANAIFDAWADAGRSRDKIITHVFNVAMNLTAVDNNISVDSLALLIADAPLMRLVDAIMMRAEVTQQDHADVIDGMLAQMSTQTPAELQN